MTSDPAWADLADGLPTHADEVMAAHEGEPSTGVQAATHGGGIPAEDRGMPDAVKYGNASPAR